MNNSLDLIKSILDQHDYRVSMPRSMQPCLYFEDASLLGAAFEFKNVAALLDNWPDQQAMFLTKNASRIKGSKDKVWNLYCIFATGESASYDDETAISQIEEDFRATRKIAQAGCTTEQVALEALFPLLPLQNLVTLSFPDVESRLQQRLQLSAPRWEALYINSNSEVLAELLTRTE